MAFAALRIKKHTRKKLAAVHGHNMRTIEVKHRDTNGKFLRLIGDKDKTT